MSLMTVFHQVLKLNEAMTFYSNETSPNLSSKEFDPTVNMKVTSCNYFIFWFNNKKENADLKNKWLPVDFWHCWIVVGQLYRQL